MGVLEFVKKFRNNLLVIADIIIVIVAYFLSMFLLFDDFNVVVINQTINSAILSIIVLQIVLHSYRAYNNMTRYETGKDYLIYIAITFISFVITMLLSIIFDADVMGLKSNMLAYILITVAIISYRLIIRITITRMIVFSSKKNKMLDVKKKNLLLIGAGSSARDIIKIIRTTMNEEYNIIGIIDDDKNKMYYSISGVSVLGNKNQIVDICKDNNVNIIFFTITQIDGKSKKDILDICQKTNAKIRILPSTESFIKNKNIMQSLRDIDIEDVLCREPIKLDNSNITKLIENKVVLVTGGGGSIGSELCRQIMQYNPEKLVILDIYENTLYDIEIELKSKYTTDKIEAVVTCVRDKKALERVFKKYNPYLVFHAAAHKHVPLMESSPLEAIKNNVFGTYNVVNMCDKYNTNKFILISTDKAVNPTNIMGATKRLCEMIIQAKNKVSSTEYVAVRFGNVLGSNGSVIPLFKKQIAAGGPITVTDKEITRYFMTIPEAVGLIIQTITYAKGGEIFVLDMGQPVKIYNLAETLIKLSGLEPHVDIQIEVVGLRPGEKLYEELLMEEEGLIKTRHDKIFIAQPSNISMDDIQQKLDQLNDILKEENYSEIKLKHVMQKVVPTYESKVNLRVV
ncbi:MAG: nucleoside-diphosphate sugar epimerase/dehydratase [Clostridia bacterium]|nr:nucleoside-diphosphate sugar epimerase/dehydratase [Clostridia bacterium]MDD4386506.1 nucleoside-diphosphate sugar epimerase/dehydratase [Clostridia bacterium]